MKEIQLSNDLNVITAEINGYKNMIGQGVFEIGKRLKHIKENDLVHGEWEKYCNEKIEITPAYANRHIKVYEEFGKANQYTSIGLSQLYQIATLPEEERDKKHTLSSGETKQVDEMTVRELQEVKRKLKERDKQLEQAKRSEEIAVRKLEQEQSKEPRVIEREVVKEVVPNDYEQAKQERDRVLQELKLLKKAQVTDHEAESRKIKALELEANKTVLTTKIKIDEFLKDVAVTAFRRGAIASSSEGTKRNLQQGVDELKNFIKEMEMALNGRIEA